MWEYWTRILESETNSESKRSHESRLSLGRRNIIPIEVKNITVGTFIYKATFIEHLNFLKTYRVALQPQLAYVVCYVFLLKLKHWMDYVTADFHKIIQIYHIMQLFCYLHVNLTLLSIFIILPIVNMIKIYVYNMNLTRRWTKGIHMKKGSQQSKNVAIIKLNFNAGFMSTKGVLNIQTNYYYIIFFFCRFK